MITFFRQAQTHASVHPGRAALCLVLALATLVGGCVTETTGAPFGGERSDTQALRDYIQLATGYLEQNDLANTKRHLDNAAGLDANNSEVAALWGLVYAQEREPDLADEQFRRALRIDPRNSKARNNYAAFLFAENRIDEAYEQLESVVADTSYSNRAQAFENLGLAALRLERSDEAEFAFTRALQLNNNQLRSSLELASIHLQKQDLRQAGIYYRNYLTLLQLYRTAQSARGLWVGIQLENALGNADNARAYGAQLDANFRGTPEHQLYRQSMDNVTP
ncbi:MAG TPA: type IV pilus biogenesis/stability protein PilW [Pseudomonadales bacterium]